MVMLEFFGVYWNCLEFSEFFIFNPFKISIQKRKVDGLIPDYIRPIRSFAFDNAENRMKVCGMQYLGDK